MQIIKNIGEPVINFEKLEVGDVFLDQGDCVCMKVPMVYDEFSGSETESLLEGCMSADDFYGHQVNAYDLERNNFFWLDDDYQVRPLKATMEVEQ